MIVVDTSALYAIVAGEPEAARFGAIIKAAGRVLIGAPTAFEFRLVVMRKAIGIDAATAHRLLATPPFEIVAWTSDLVDLASDAFDRFRGRPASLNYGDCMAYALAKSLDVPLLYKGGDFARTDIGSAA